MKKTLYLVALFLVVISFSLTPPSGLITMAIAIVIFGALLAINIDMPHKTPEEKSELFWRLMVLDAMRDHGSHNDNHKS
jgi:hypothetical protein